MPTPPDTPFARALRKMSLPELQALWAAALDGRLDDGLPPAERLAAWYRRKKREAFIERMRRLSVQEMQKAHSRLVQGEDPDLIFKEMPSS